jgi:hypothetical protein
MDKRVVLSLKSLTTIIVVISLGIILMDCEQEFAAMQVLLWPPTIPMEETGVGLNSSDVSLLVFYFLD